MYKPLFVLALLVLKIAPSAAQNCRTFECAVQAADKQLKDRKYTKALTDLDDAEDFAANDEPKKAVVREQRKRVFDAIEKEKNEVKRQKDRSDGLLNQLRQTSDQAVKLLLNEIDRNILRLEYDSTYQKCKIALELNSEKYGRPVKERVLEIAFWYAETDTARLAVKMLKLLKIDAPPDRGSILTAIKKNCSPAFDVFLEERYYPKMIRVDSGSFTMTDYFRKTVTANGSTPSYSIVIDSAIIRVGLSPYKIAETETTVWQYFLYLKANRQTPGETPSWGFLGNNPVVNVSWYDAALYNNWLSDRKTLVRAYTIDTIKIDSEDIRIRVDVQWTDRSNGYRLPTEAEWEFAARGGVRSKGYKYSGSNNIDSVAWYGSNSKSTNGVHLKDPNELGIYDMSGNASEWCNDWYGEYDSSADSNSDSATMSAVKNTDSSAVYNPTGAVKGSRRVDRGGSWNLNAVYCRVSGRDAYAPTYRYCDLGFRVASSL